MNAGYAFTTSKKAYSLLKMFFKQLYQEGATPNNPMALIDMTKKDNYLAAQNKESKPQCDLVVVFTDEELEKIREEAFKRFANGKPVYQQAEAYFLLLNTGLRAGELCGIINSDIWLNDNGRKKVLTKWQEKKRTEYLHPYLKQKIPFGLIPYVQSNLLAKYVRGEIEEYPCFLLK